MDPVLKEKPLVHITYLVQIIVLFFHKIDDLGLLPGLDKTADRVGLGSDWEGTCSDWEGICSDWKGIFSDWAGIESDC